MKRAERIDALAFLVAIGCCFGSVAIPAAERINHEGRILGAVPAITNSLLFNTPQADAVISALQIFPPNNAWNEDISRRPLLSNSAAMMTQVVNDLSTNRRTLRPFQEMNFVIVPNNQPLVPINLYEYPDESDPSPYPDPVEHARGILADTDRWPDPLRMAARRASLGRRPPLDHICNRAPAGFGKCGRHSYWCPARPAIGRQRTARFSTSPTTQCGLPAGPSADAAGFVHVCRPGPL
jgi:hypothetical protein